MALADFARRVAPEHASSERPLPVLSSNGRDELPELLQENPTPAMLGRRDFLWGLFGGHDPVIHAHYHSRHHVVMCQVRGEKRGMLYAPSDTSRLYPHPVYSIQYSVARVNMDAPDLMKFPKFRGAQPHEVFLEPGDALFIPVHWWHSTRGFGTSLSAAISWNASLREHHFPQPGIRNLVASALARARVRGIPLGFRTTSASR